MKTTAILVQLAMPLRYLPSADLIALRRFLFRWCRGLSDEHSKAWIRMWKRLHDSPQSQPVLQFYEITDRDGRFHRKHMAIEDAIFDSQDCFYVKAAFRIWLKTGACFGRFVATPVGLVFEPSSLSWEDCSDDEMHQFHEDALTFLRTPAALATLWPVVKPELRPQMLEACLCPPQNEDQP